MLKLPKSRSAGGVVINFDDLVLIRAPKKGFDGYIWTHAKGGADSGETDPQAALREVREETGWVCKISRSLGEFEGTTTVTTYYLMRPIKDLGHYDKETEKVEWVTQMEAARRFQMTTNHKGKIRDLAVLELAFRAHYAIKPKPPTNQFI